MQPVHGAHVEPTFCRCPRMIPLTEVWKGADNL
jgi:hypothetical protein